MKLPPEYVITTFTEMRMAVELQERHATPEESRYLEMSEEQYLVYVKLVYESDPVRFFDGMRIMLPPKVIPSLQVDG